MVEANNLSLALITAETRSEQAIGMEENEYIQQRADTEGMTAQEAVVYRKLKSFCANIIKKLAPPLLWEVQASQLRPEAEPFTPKRTMRASKKSAAPRRTKDNPACCFRVWVWFRKIWW